MSTTIKFQPALIGGLVMGVLSALPLISVGNVCCCLWVISGGVVAAYLLQQSEPAPITPADGALIGFIAGIAGAFVYLVISIPISMTIGPMEREMVRRWMESLGGADGFRNYTDRANVLAGPIQAIIGFIFMLFAGAVFSTIGGLIGVAIFKKPLPPLPPAPPPGPFDQPSAY